MYNLRTLNHLTLPKINAKSFGLYSSCFRVIQLWNQLPDHTKNETSVRALLVENWLGNTYSCTIYSF